MKYIIIGTYILIQFMPGYAFGNTDQSLRPRQLAQKKTEKTLKNENQENNVKGIDKHQTMLKIRTVRPSSRSRYTLATGVPNGGDEVFTDAVPYSEVKPQLLREAYQLLKNNIAILAGGKNSKELYPKKFLNDLEEQLDKLIDEDRILYLPGINSILMEVPSTNHNRVISNRAYTFPHRDSPIYLASGSINYSVLDLANAIADEVPEQVLMPEHLRFDDDYANTIGIEWSHGHPTEEMSQTLRGHYYLHNSLDYRTNTLVIEELAKIFQKLQFFKVSRQYSWDQFKEKYSIAFYIQNPTFDINPDWRGIWWSNSEAERMYHSHYCKRFNAKFEIGLTKINSITAKERGFIKGKKHELPLPTRRYLFDHFQCINNNTMPTVTYGQFQDVLNYYKYGLAYNNTPNIDLVDISKHITNAWITVIPEILYDNSVKGYSLENILGAFNSRVQDNPSLNLLNGEVFNLESVLKQQCERSKFRKKIRYSKTCVVNSTIYLYSQLLLNLEN